MRPLYQYLFSTNGHLSTGHLSTNGLFILFWQAVDSLTTATQWQGPLKCVPNCQNNLSTMARFFSDWCKSQQSSHEIFLMARWWLIAAIVVWLCFIYCCSKYKLPTMPIANVAKLASFVMLTFLNVIKPFCVYYILFMIGLLFSMGNSKHELAQ